MTPQSIAQWTYKINRVWNPTRIRDTRVTSDGGLVIIADLDPGLRLHIGVDDEGVNLCGIWRDEECVMWTRSLGFYFTSGLIPAPPEVPPSDFENSMRHLITRNCELLGSS